MAGRNKNPPALKVIAGTDRKDREAPSSVELPVIENVPEAPDWLPNDHARKEWARLAPILVANRLKASDPRGESNLVKLFRSHGITPKIKR